MSKETESTGQSFISSFRRAENGIETKPAPMILKNADDVARLKAENVRVGPEVEVPTCMYTRSYLPFRAL